MTEDLEVNRPEVVDEITLLFEAYEAALSTKILKSWTTLFGTANTQSVTPCTKTATDLMKSINTEFQERKGLASKKSDDGWRF